MPKRKHYNSSDEDDPYGSASDDDGDYKRKKKPAAKKAKKTPTPKKVSTKTTVATDTITKSPIALPNFSEEDVLKIVGKGSFMKGQEIYDKNYISELVYVKEADPVQLTCVCKATSGSPYNLKLTFKNDFKKKLMMIPMPIHSTMGCAHVLSVLKVNVNILSLSFSRYLKVKAIVKKSLIVLPVLLKMRVQLNQKLMKYLTIP